MSTNIQSVRRYYDGSPIPKIIELLRIFLIYLVGKPLAGRIDKGVAAWTPDELRRRVDDQLAKVKVVLYSELEHWYVLVSILVAGGIFITMGAGRDVALGLFDHQDKTYERFVFSLTVGFSLFMYALICWRLPIHYIADKFLKPADSNIDIANQQKSLVHPTRQEVYRANGLLIYTLIMVWLLTSHFKISALKGLFLLIGIQTLLWTLGSMLASWLNHLRLKWQSASQWSWKARNPLTFALIWLFVILNGALLLAVIFLTEGGNQTGTEAESRAMSVILSVYLGLFALLFWVFSDYFDRIAREQKVRSFTEGWRWLNAFANQFISHDIEQDLKINTWKRPFLYLHVFGFVSIVFTVLYYYFAPNLQVNNPLFAVIFGAAFLVYVLDWVNYLYFRNTFILHRWFLIVLSVVLGFMVFYGVWTKSFDEISFYINSVMLLIAIRWVLKPNDQTAKKGIMGWLSNPSKTFKDNQLQLFSTCLVAYLLLNLIMPNHASHNAKLTNERAPIELMPLENYVEGWLDNRLEGHDTAAIFDVYILAGQGGGSRAAYWFSKVATHLNQELKGGFRERCLALSTVSGSSVGAQSIVALWAKKPNAPTSITEGFSRNAFSHNYLAGGLSDIFFRDNIASFWPSTGNRNPLLGSRGGRNRRLQKEEASRIEDAIEGKDWDMYGGFPLWTSMTSYYPDTTTADQDFWSFYYNSQNQPTYQVPLFFANTTQVKEGKRSFVSPVKMDSAIFRNTFNLTDLLRKHRKGIALTGAANLSELFPYISASTRFNLLKNNDLARTNGVTPNEAEEYFVDGGYYENYGLTTAGEVYRMAQNVINKHPRFRNVRLKLVMIANAQTGSATNLNSMSQTMIPPTAMYQTAFGGHAESALTDCRADMPQNCFYEVVLDEGGNFDEVPLSRLLSKKVITTMDTLVKSEKGILRLVRDFDRGLN
jgi:hypothetical protein